VARQGPHPGSWGTGAVTECVFGSDSPRYPAWYKGVTSITDPGGGADFETQRLGERRGQTRLESPSPLRFYLLATVAL
jgi:hypothetical protein